MSNIVFLDRASLPPHIRLATPDFAHKWIEFDNTTQEQRIERLRHADIVISNKVVLDKDILVQCPRLKHIAIAATGTNNVDLAACHELGISVSNIRGYATTSVPEHVLMMTLMLRRQISRYQHLTAEGAWSKSDQFYLIDKPIQDIAGATFGIIGFGELGQATAKLMHAMGMRVIYCSRSDYSVSFASAVNFDDLISESDVISLHCTLTPETENLIGAKEFAAMKSDAIVINTARGGIINEQDAYDAINNETIAGLGIDVLSQEPPSEENPVLKLAKRDNVIITPHTAWASDQSIQALADQLIDNINAFHKGEAQNLVDV